ncbi:MAG: hypothetical protein GVY13_04190 [Alphaproteobacteria bacterium]|nr:hypothetical protein [Alphaproteobacteria bacterium]
MTESDLTGNYFLFFTTYPDCGVTCHPFFIKLNHLFHFQQFKKKLVIVNFPFEPQPYHLFHEYYKAEKVVWPWVMSQYFGSMKSQLGQWGINVGGCPRLSLAYGSKDGVPQQIMSSFGSAMWQHTKTFDYCYKI